jgi:hypothetical protein
MNDIDIQEKVRGLDIYKDINLIIDQISVLPVGQPLVWVYVWDVIKDLWTSIMEGQEEEYCVTMELEEVWELFWDQADKNGFTLEYGTEDLYEHIRDWMTDESIIEETPEDEEVDGDDKDMLESTGEEV